MQPGTEQRPSAGVEENGRQRRPWGATVAFGLLGLFGGLISLVVAIDFLQAISTYSWDETTCTIESSSVDERPADDSFELRVSYRYHARGDSFLGDRVSHGYTGSSSASDAHRLAGRYTAGETVRCWVHPDDPSRSYLQRANPTRGFLLFIPLVFVAVAGGGLYLARGRGTSKPDAGSASPAKPIRAAIGVGILFGVFFLFGFGLFIPFFVLPALKVAEARAWTPVECEIVSSGVRTQSGDDGDTYSVEALYRYRVDGREYVSNRYQFMGGSSSGYDRKAKAVERIPAGSVTSCYVDPEDPYEAVIDRGFGLDFLFGLIPLLFGLIGAGGLFFAFWVKRSARKQASLPSPSAVVATYKTGPTELEPSLGPLGKLGCAAMVALFWNGIVSVFLWVLVRDWRAGSPDWFLALFLIPFVLIGLLLLSSIPYSLLALANPRPQVRLSTRRLKAGETAQLDWSFRGATGRIEALKIWLECSKRETRTTETNRGVSTSSRTEPVREIPILERGEGWPLAFGSVSFRVPADAEPTSSGDDAFLWKLRFQGRIDYWPDTFEEFEVEILPADSQP